MTQNVPMNYFNTNLKYLRELKGLSQEDLAEEFKCTRTRVSSYETGRNEPPLDMLIEVSKFFEIPADTLIKYDLRKSKNQSFIEIGNNRIVFPIVVNEEGTDSIEVVPIEASAGYLNGYDDPEYIADLQRFNLPFIPTGKYRAFPIKGDSMLPQKNGSFIVGEFVEDISEVRNGDTYVIVTKNDGMTYKQVFNKITESGSLLLVPYNKSYTSYEVSAEDVLELWKFKCSINLEEFQEHELKFSGILNLFNELQIELSSIKEMKI